MDSVIECGLKSMTKVGLIETAHFDLRHLRNRLTDLNKMVQDRDSSYYRVLIGSCMHVPNGIICRLIYKTLVIHSHSPACPHPHSVVDDHRPMY